MKKLTHIFAPLFSMILLFPLDNHAYGGAGGGGCDNSGKLIKAAINGLPIDLDRELDASVAQMQKVVTGRRPQDSEKKFFAKWLDPKMVNGSPDFKRSAIVELWESCSGVKLLDGAVAGANIGNIKRLIELGADPNILSRNVDTQTVFMRCPVIVNDYLTTDIAPENRSLDDEKKTIATYNFLLSVGADVNQVSTRGYTALHFCRDPLVIDFLLKNGADVYVNQKLFEQTKGSHPTYLLVNKLVLDYRVDRIVKGYVRNRENDFNSLSMILSNMKNPQLTDVTERDLAWRCKLSGVKEVCRKLSTMIRFQNDEIYKAISQ